MNSYGFRHFSIHSARTERIYGTTDRPGLSLFIENDRELLGQYLHTVEGKELDTVNAHIAQAIKRHFALESKGERCDTPKSKLIQGYEKLR